MHTPARWFLRWKVLLPLACFIWALTLSAWGGDVGKSEKGSKSFDIPAGAAEKTLATFANQSGVELLYATNAVAGIRTKAVKGEMVPSQALKAMTDGTILVVEHDEKNDVWRVTRKVPSDPNAKRATPVITSARPENSPTADPENSPTADKVVAMNPFEVIASETQGYLAPDTLSGTRLDTKIEDLAVPITVVTKQQMLDTAVLDLNDVFLYEAGTEGTGNYAAFTVNRNGGINDSVQNDPATANRIRGIGSVNVTVGGFAVNPSIPLDLYNVEAVEILRGPNSNIFGLGATAGTVNYVPIQANTTRPMFRVTLRGDNFGGSRGSIDFNVPLINNKLAVRVAAVHDMQAFERKPSGVWITGLEGLVTYRPFSKTTIRVSAERFSEFSQPENTFLPETTVPGWVADGSPTWNPTTQMVTFADGTTEGPFTVKKDGSLPYGLIASKYKRMNVGINPGSQYMSVTEASKSDTPWAPKTDVRLLESSSTFESLGPTLYPLYQLPAITDKSVYDWSSVNFMAPNNYTQNAKTYTFEVLQTLIDTPQHLLAARFGGFKQKMDTINRNQIDNTASILRVDVNETNIDGTPNPDFLHPYFGTGNPTTNYIQYNRDILNADLAYQWTPQKLPRWLGWIGQQRMDLHGEYWRTDDASFRLRDVELNTGQAWWDPTTGVSNKAAEVYDKYYVGNAVGQNIDYAPSSQSIDGPQTLVWYNGSTKQWVSEPVTVAAKFFNGNNFTDERTEIRTINATLQSYFLRDRLITTLGWRRDRQRIREVDPPVLDPSTGYFDFSPLAGSGPWIYSAGNTKTLGAVLKPTSWLRLFYNQSDSFNPATIAYDGFGNLLPNPNGKGKDYGIGLSLFHGRLYLKIDRYETFDKGARGGDLDTVLGRALSLDGKGTDNDPSVDSDLYTFAYQSVTENFAKQGVTPTAAQTEAAVAQMMGVSTYWLDHYNSWPTGTTADVDSHGYEIELTYNPTSHWRMKFNAAQEVAINNNVGGTLAAYIAARLPIWKTVKNVDGVLWWTYSLNGAATAEQTYVANIAAPYELDSANNGKDVSQLREWHLNYITHYDFTRGWLKGFSVGGALRWESKGAIGYYGAAPDADGVVRSWDPNRPIYDGAHLDVDLSVGYRLVLWGGRVRAQIQLFVRNANESGGLRPVGANPNGSIYAYQIVDPRQFILSTRFAL